MSDIICWVLLQLAAGALVTTHRLLLVSTRLQVLASTPVLKGGDTVVSALWLGPALLFTTAAQQVRTLQDRLG